MSDPENPPAFPAEYETAKSKPGDRAWVGHPGMTLLDYFAGQALANPHIAEDYAAIETATLARRVYRIAAAMIAQRKAK